MKAATKWTLGILGAGAAIGGIWALTRKTTVFGEYHAGPMPMPRVVGTTRGDGRTATLYRGPRLSIKQRIGVIQKAVFDGVNDPKMRQLALSITRGCPERDGMCEARAVFNAVKDRIRYTGDVGTIKHPDGSVEGIDYFQTGNATWNYTGGGDCDDHAVLLSTLLALNGITPRLRVTAQKGEDDSHIYVIAGMPKNNPTKWIALDTTLPGRRFNVEAPYARLTDYDA